MIGIIQRNILTSIPRTFRPFIAITAHRPLIQNITYPHRNLSGRVTYIDPKKKFVSAHEKGLDLLKDQKYDQCYKFFSLCSMSDENTPFTMEEMSIFLNEQGVCLLMQNHLDSALEHFKKAYHYNPDQRILENVKIAKQLSAEVDHLRPSLKHNPSDFTQVIAVNLMKSPDDLI